MRVLFCLSSTSSSSSQISLSHFCRVLTFDFNRRCASGTRDLVKCANKFSHGFLCDDDGDVDECGGFELMCVSLIALMTWL